jgi:hypothetical protein
MLIVLLFYSRPAICNTMLACSFTTEEISDDLLINSRTTPGPYAMNIETGNAQAQWTATDSKALLISYDNRADQIFSPIQWGLIIFGSILAFFGIMDIYRTIRNEFLC